MVSSPFPLVRLVLFLWKFPSRPGDLTASSLYEARTLPAGYKLRSVAARARSPRRPRATTRRSGLFEPRNAISFRCNCKKCFLNSPLKYVAISGTGIGKPLGFLNYCEEIWISTEGAQNGEQGAPRAFPGQSRPFQFNSGAIPVPFRAMPITSACQDIAGNVAENTRQ